MGISVGVELPWVPWPFVEDLTQVKEFEEHLCTHVGNQLFQREKMRWMSHLD